MCIGSMAYGMVWHENTTKVNKYQSTFLSGLTLPMRRLSTFDTKASAAHTRNKQTIQRIRDQEACEIDFRTYPEQA